MIEFYVFTLFPQLFKPLIEEGLLGRAVKQNKLKVELIDFRQFGLGPHKKVDDTPFGGGAGMVLRPEPIIEALKTTEEKIGKRLHRVLLSPQGAPFTQARAHQLAESNQPIGLIAGRYEGYDERIRHFVDEEISLGDFVLLGGEVPAMALIEAIGRLGQDVIGNEDSLKEESFQQPLLEYPQYTKPQEFEGIKVPPVLLSGHHGEIEKWRLEEAKKRTQQRRPDLFQAYIKENKAKS